MKTSGPPRFRNASRGDFLLRAGPDPACDEDEKETAPGASGFAGGEVRGAVALAVLNGEAVSDQLSAVSQRDFLLLLNAER